MIVADNHVVLSFVADTSVKESFCQCICQGQDLPLLVDHKSVQPVIVLDNLVRAEGIRLFSL